MTIAVKGSTEASDLPQITQIAQRSRADVFRVVLILENFDGVFMRDNSGMSLIGLACGQKDEHQPQEREA